MICEICEHELPDEEFATSGKNSIKRGMCRNCYNKRRRGDDDSGKVFCRYCKVYKHQSEFNRDFTVSSTYRTQCKACQYETQKNSTTRSDEELYAEEQAAEAFRVFVEINDSDFESLLDSWPTEKLRRLRYYLPLHYALSDIHRANTTPQTSQQIVVGE